MLFTERELDVKLTDLLALPAETECVEFKEAKTGYDFDNLGRYFSALSNEANLKGQKHGWLIFGVKDKPRPREIVGSRFREQRAALDSLKHEVAKQTSNGLTFEEIYVHTRPQGRVVMFQIPAALRGIPTAWKGHWYGRNGESLGALGIQDLEQIRHQDHDDWSAQVCPEATLIDLEPEAVEFARRQYRAKNPKYTAEMEHWDDATFLNKAKVCIAGKITRTAIILLGKEESEHFIAPGLARISWILKDTNGIELDYQHFGPPLLLNADAAYAKIRNLNYRYLHNNHLFPTEITKYEPWVIREALHNCIAHQDYRRGGRINLVEDGESILMTNLGHFIPETVERVIEQDAPQETYRNPFLSAAMVNLNMIDTIGSGIRRMFNEQRKRFFPLPDYDLSDPQRVRVRVIGKVLNENYTRILMAKTDIALADVIALDKVQKKISITDAEFRSLKAKKLVEGRRPNLFVSARVAEATGERAAYIRNRAFDKDHYKNLVLDFLKQFSVASREDLDDLLFDKLSDTLDDRQKRTFVTNLLQEMRRQGSIRPDGTTRWAKWVISEPPSESRD